MAAVTMRWFTKAQGKPIDWVNDTIKVALVNAVPDQDTPEFWADISATEVTGANWAAGGQTLGTKARVVTVGTNTVAWDAADINVAAVTVSGVEAIVVYRDTANPATSDLLGLGDLDVAGASTGGALTITWDTDGILVSTAA